MGKEFERGDQKTGNFPICKRKIIWIWAKKEFNVAGKNIQFNSSAEA